MRDSLAWIRLSWSGSNNNYKRFLAYGCILSYRVSYMLILHALFFFNTSLNFFPGNTASPVNLFNYIHKNTIYGKLLRLKIRRILPNMRIIYPLGLLFLERRIQEYHILEKYKEIDQRKTLVHNQLFTNSCNYLYI